MDETAQQLFNSFAQAADRATLRCDDWARLYDFVIYVHVHHVPVAAWEVRDELLIAHNFSIRKASWLSTEFNRLSEILARYDTQRYRNLSHPS